MLKKIELKLSFRSFLRNKWYNILNIFGLSLGLATFILVMLYVNQEINYDRWNKNLQNVFLVELDLPNGTSPYTPGLLAGEIKKQCPEIQEVGRVNTAAFEVPFYSESGKFLIKKWVGADYSIANILGVEANGIVINPQNATETALLSPKTAQILFPNQQAHIDKVVNLMSKSGPPMEIHGTAKEFPGKSHFNFDCIVFSNDITSGKDNSYENRIYQTYVMVRPSTDVGLLTDKIDRIYKEAVLSDSSVVAKNTVLLSNKPIIYLDPLRNLHLQPRYGSNESIRIVQGLSILAIIILVVSGVNFTNLYISQANRRAKEVGLKKVNGVPRGKIIIQFISEIFIQCLMALILSFLFVLIGLPYFNNLLQVDILLSSIDLKIWSILILTLVVLTIIAGMYPSLFMARFKPTLVLRSNQLTANTKLSWIPNFLMVFQFFFAVSFIIILLVVNQQVSFMRSGDTGFNTKGVVYIDNLTLYNSPNTFEPVRTRLKELRGVNWVTVASNIPGGIPPNSWDYTYRDQAISMNTISVDFEYFETLEIKPLTGKTFALISPNDSLSAVINLSAAKKMNLRDPIGASISGCGKSYKIIGIVNDVKANGFEKHVEPTVYLMKDGCGLAKTQIMINADLSALPQILSTIGNQWKDINKLDGETFSYHFLDELYEQLFVKQIQLRAVLVLFSILAILIAALGLFSLVTHSIALRTREIAVRKVLGANIFQIMTLFGRKFLLNVLIANAISCALTFYLVNRWLESFTYRIQVSYSAFVIAFVISVSIGIVSICFQIANIKTINPAVKLKN